MTAEVESERLAQLQEARQDLDADAQSLEAAVWVGRRTAYLGRYRDAVQVYSEGIAVLPDAPELYRHRGHRYITLRDFDLAIEDFEQAVVLIEDGEDVVEADGQPNARNIPTSTLQFNIWYHLGLAYYLKGEFESALRCYRECMEVSGNPDALVATSHWLYMTLRRLERDEEALQVLEPITADLDVIENGAYHQLLLMYKGESQPEELLGGDGDGVQSATVAYGVGNWYLYNGDVERAREVFASIVTGEQWPAFGHVAAEADLVASEADLRR
jgi:tetratricopeptide (TPR) repeat protein